MISRQLDILQALTAQIEGVNPDNGYTYDLRGVVYRGRTMFGDDTPVPSVSILEAPRPGITLIAEEQKLVRKTTWELLVQGWAQDDKMNPLDPVYPLKSSVEQQLSRVMQRMPGGAAAFPDEYLLGKNPSGKNRIIAVNIGPGVCRPPDAKLSARAFFYLPLTIEYMEDLSSPFV